MNGFELQAQADHDDIFLIIYLKHGFWVHVRTASLRRFYLVLMIYSRENITKRNTRRLLEFRAFTVTHIFTSGFQTRFDTSRTIKPQRMAIEA